ncbi:aminoglycoside phosphotransferase family protein [Micromonospora peucetia]|uniref:Aminoglycoside phosphotransferase family protein n=1 Tax=Micromonospora peucetia TaxID=47871 RepID=A0A1C6UCV3_9ACTN|nr:aminoglycoside phosphotransferase family protein [Micromonospora peucetia]MCX4386486.1 aminoglycoside phosphotransferase family protein [Micromonospora peucetia]WSA33821.1 aminoglycoside phosphotransferase family protein [Micromonospora peucetia]SCL51689.1 Phosphotransferase enzyme family protein [Micromonospora peucetia]
MPRSVTLVLVDAAGAPLGALPPFDVPSPWWQEVAPVVAEARRRYGIEVAVLRLLTGARPQPAGGSARPQPAGGAVTYLGQVDELPATPLVPAEVDLSADPLRAAYAEPGGPARSLAWATGELRRLGRPAETITQQRTWNLSAIWRLDGPGGTAWLKQVPVFFRHEAAVLRWLGRAVPGKTPTLLADDGDGRMLLDHVPGEDRYGAPVEERLAMAADYHPVQVRSVPDVAELVAAGVPDLRGPALPGWIRSRLAGSSAVEFLLAGLAARLDEVRGCGLPETLVHGDLHPGNVRADAGRHVVIDWGDAFVGHPAFDVLRLVEGLPDVAAAPVLSEWCARWRFEAPGCEPERAVELLRPVAALRMAAVYAMFLDGIEESERVYHATDVDTYLEQALAQVASSA